MPMLKDNMTTNRKIPVISKLFPEELFGFVFLLVLVIISIVFNKMPNYNRITGRHYFRFFTYGLLIYILFGGKLKKIGLVIRNFFPLILMTTVFENLGDLVTKINPNYADLALIKIDKFLFGVDPSMWMQQFITPWLSSLMHTAYTSYFFIPPVVSIVLYLSGKHKEFRDFIVAVTFTAFLGYIGYVLIPAIGPRFTIAHLYTTDLKTGALLSKIVKIINDYEPFKADCFPSLHTAHTLVAMIFAAKYTNKFFSIPLNILGSLLIISTMYGRYHYGIDVIAGILLAILNCYLAPRINKLWYNKVFYDDWKNHYPGKLRLSGIKNIFNIFTVFKKKNK